MEAGNGLAASSPSWMQGIWTVLPTQPPSHDAKEPKAALETSAQGKGRTQVLWAEPGLVRNCSPQLWLTSNAS